MKYINKSASFLAAALLVNTGWSQTSVFDCPLPVQSYDLVSPTAPPHLLEGGCFDFSHPDNYSYPLGTNNEFRACKNIRVENDFKMGSSSSGGKFKLTMANADIVLLEPNDLNSIPRYEKMELGIDLPDDIQARVDAFIANEIDPNGLNPFLEWKLKIKATFTYMGSWPPPGTGPLQRELDAFYFRDFERVVTGDSPLNDSDLSHDYYLNSNPEYQNWGGHWEPQANEHPFRIRFAPTELGIWDCKIEVFINDNSVPDYDYDNFQFNVVNSSNLGFVKVGNSKRYFTRGDETFIPLGPNFAWPSTKEALDAVDYAFLTNNNPLASGGNAEQYRRYTAPLKSYINYETHLNQLSDKGANHFRMIMSGWALDIEFEKLGNYYDRQHIAWEMDNIVNIAKQKNLNIQWDLMVQYTLEGNPYGMYYWDWYAGDEYEAFDSDYPNTFNNVDDPGYCYHHNNEFDLVDPNEMFTNPEAIKYYKQRLRYISSRWGYSTNIGMWELASEVNLVGSVSNYMGGLAVKPPYEPCEPEPCDQLPHILAQIDVKTWHEEIADYLKNILGDPRPISASYAGTIGDADNTHSLSVIDFTSENQYNNEKSPSFIHFACGDNNFIELMGSYGSGKPVSFSEHGLRNLKNCAENHEIKKEMWMLPFSGVAMANDWTIWEYTDYWDDYKKVKNFIGDINLDAENWIPGQYTTGYPSAWNDMARGDKKADMVYLRSGDKKYAMGVINNRTDNFYTHFSPSVDPCDNGSVGIFEELIYQTKQTVSAGIASSDWLRLRNMDFPPFGSFDYTVDYFYVDAPDVVIASQSLTTTTGDIVLEHPDLNDTHPIIAFKAYPTASGWKSAQIQVDSTSENKLNPAVYPNPTNGQLIVEITALETDEVYELTLYNSMGQTVKQIKTSSRQTTLDMSSFENGIYLLSLTNGKTTQVTRISKVR